MPLNKSNAEVYQLSAFYKRDANFAYNDELNKYDSGIFFEGNIIVSENHFIYNTDKINSYTTKYDILPTTGAPLVSMKFMDCFSDDNQIQYLPTEIIDDFGNSSSLFLAINVLNVVSCMDLNQSIYEKTSYGTMRIKKLTVKAEALEGFDIVRMKEHLSYLIVTDSFKSKCEKNGLIGFDFIKNGSSIYTNL